MCCDVYVIVNCDSQAAAQYSDENIAADVRQTTRKDPTRYVALAIDSGLKRF